MRWGLLASLLWMCLVLTNACQCDTGPGIQEQTKAEGNTSLQEISTVPEPNVSPEPTQQPEPRDEPAPQPEPAKEPKPEPTSTREPKAEPAVEPLPVEPKSEPVADTAQDAGVTPEPSPEPTEPTPDTLPDGSVTITDSRNPVNKIPFGPNCPVQGQSTLKGHTTTYKTKNAEHQCSGTFTKYEITPIAGKAELHIVGVYEGAGGTQQQPGNISVQLNRAGDQVLVLSAYDPVNWTVTIGLQTKLLKVIVTGYHTQTVTAPAGVKVENYTYQGGNALTPAFAYSWPSARGTQFVSTIEALTKLSLSSFRGCYSSSSITIGAYAPVPPGGSLKIPLLSQCSSILNERAYCLALFGTSDSKNLGLVGLDSGTLCQYQQAINARVSHDGSIGWVGPYVYGCDRSGVVFEIDIATGSVRFSKRPCTGVTSYQCKIHVTPKSSTTNRVEEYDDFARITDLTKQPNKTYNYNGYKRVFASHQSTFWYPTNHSTDTTKHIPMGTTTMPNTTTLQGYKDWIYGFDVLSNDWMVIGSPRAMQTGHKPSREGLILFHKLSGQLLRRIHMRSPKFELLQAIKCFDRGK